MTVQEEVLNAARRICAERGSWTFTPNEIVRALPHLDAGSVRTHVTSRCCVNAPAHHAHRWDYFRRVRRGMYEIRPKHRPSTPAGRAETERHAGPAGRVAEARAIYRADAPPRDAVHAFVSRDRGWYLAECAEIHVVTQGRTLDELVANLREAVGLHLEGGDAAHLGFAAEPRLVLTYETRLGHGTPPQDPLGP